MTQLDLFDLDNSNRNFEDFSHENGFTYWFAADLMEFLGYENWSSFNKSINKAMTTCNSLNIPILDNFIQEYREVDGKQHMDFRLSRFACYLTVMNSDPKKPAVAKAQAYFATLAGAVHNFIEESNKVERIVIREEISERESSLHGVVATSGIINYAYFQNAGYRGMYNKNIRDLKLLRKINDHKSLLDYMGKDELAANLFRITQTELKIKNDNIHGQTPLEAAAHAVGKKVRETMMEISNVPPERLPVHDEIKEVKKQLKSRSKKFKQIDTDKKKEIDSHE